MLIKVLLLFSATLCTGSASDTPIIGILSQELSSSMENLWPDEQFSSYIAASYVKFVESAGGRVAPILINQSLDYYEAIVNSTNGLLFPGGSASFRATGGYKETAGILYELALEKNKQGVYYPVWGTCLGMEVIIVSIVGSDVRLDCSASKISLPLVFEKDYQTSRLFSGASDEIIEILSSKNVTYNNHIFCFDNSTFEDNGIYDDFQIMTTNEDVNGYTFISTYESKLYPIYGVQFHPEKNPFEFKTTNADHSKEAVKATQYFANFFVDECRKNNQKFSSISEERSHLIFNNPPRYTGSKSSSYEQLYFFQNENIKQVEEFEG